MTGGSYLDKARSQRIRRLVRKLNESKRIQAKKIDILCNDMVSAHADFVDRLGSLTFGVNFYESILGQSDLTTLLNIAAEHIKGTVRNANVAVFLVGCESFELHMVDEDTPIEITAERLESYFTSETAQSICRANWVCSLEDMLAMGLVGNPNELAKISAAAVPLRRFGPGVGFILIYRGAEDALSRNELEKVAAITPGLCRAIEACQGVAHTSSIHQA